MIFNDQNFIEEVEKFDGLAMVDFYATWCGPCQLMAPIIQELIDEYKDNSNVKIGKMDIDQNPTMTEKYEVMSVPTIILFKQGKIINKKIGYADKAEFKQMIDDNL